MVVAWWSGGITSAVACKIAVDLYDKVRVIFMDTKNEHPDTERFRLDCEKWYGQPIETISAIPDKYESIQDTWYRHQSLNVANGAICSSVLKRRLREDWQKQNDYSQQVFGFEFEQSEFKRAKAMKINHPQAKPIFPLLMTGLTKEDCMGMVIGAGIKPPEMYALGFTNNNCFGTGCVQGGVGYWKKIQREFPEKFEAMAKVEHDLTDLKGKPVTCLRDQSKKSKDLAKTLDDSSAAFVFLKKHPNYDNKCLDDMTGREPEPLMDCNGFCGINDLLGGA